MYTSSTLEINEIYEEDGETLFDVTHFEPDGNVLREQTSSADTVMKMFLQAEYVDISKDSSGHDFDFAEYTDDGKKIIHEENE